VSAILNYLANHPQEILLAMGVLIAGAAIHSNRDIAKKREALAVIMASKNDSKLGDAIIRCTAIHLDNNASFDRLAYDPATLSEAELADRKLIAYMLNHYEYVAVGIHNNIYCEATIKRASFSTMTQVYKLTVPFVDKLKALKDNRTFYQEFQCLAQRWIDKPLKARKKTKA